MRSDYIRSLLVAVLALTPIGCEPRPVVVDPDDDTTVIEERDVEVAPDAVDTTPDADGDISVGGEKGVDVDVDRDASREPNPNP